MKIDTNFKKKTGWALLMLMSKYKIRTAAQLRRKLMEYGIEMTSIHLSRLINERPNRLNIELLDAFCNMFECTPNDLLPFEDVVQTEEPVEANSIEKVKPQPSKVVPFKKKEQKPEPKKSNKKSDMDIPMELLGTTLVDEDDDKDR